MIRFVLIVAADPAVASLHQACLEAEGLRVEAASTAAEGLALARERPPAAVVADIDLPDLNAAELTARLRQSAAGRDFPIFILANTHLPLAREAALTAGATDCLDKSACSPELVAAAVVNSLPAAPAIPAESTAGAVAISRIEVLRRSYLARAEAKLHVLRSELVDAKRANVVADFVPVLARLSHAIESIATAAGAMGHPALARLASALSALCYHLSIETDKIGASPLRTVGSAVDVLISLCRADLGFDSVAAPTPLILAVDDLAIARESVRRSLERAQMNVITLHSPRMALDLAKMNAFDLILLDLLMPELSGFELCREIRNLPHGREVPVIFVTGIDDFEARAQAKMHGGSDFIAKPFLASELATKVLLHLLPSDL